ncbi:MAG: LemA family protein [Candidatus Micrarchaeota archaeon]|nr:LemA family protein [Candidatus Micrarchaeota archaeon]
MELLIYIFAGLFILVLLFFILTYNYLITLRNRIDNAWAQIDVQLKRRYDLVPNLVETVKGYAKHERELFESVTKARAAMASAGTVAEKAKADNILSSTLKSLFAVAENYPQLRANENFKMLQEELAGIENKIAYARQFYNDSVLSYNTAIQHIPTNIVAAIFNFKAREFFKTEGSERENVKVKF